MKHIKSTGVPSGLRQRPHYQRPLETYLEYEEKYRKEREDKFGAKPFEDKEVIYRKKKPVQKQRPASIHPLFINSNVRSPKYEEERLSAKEEKKDRRVTWHVSEENTEPIGTDVNKLLAFYERKSGGRSPVKEKPLWAQTINNVQKCPDVKVPERNGCNDIPYRRNTNQVCPDVKVPERNGYNDIPYRRNTNQVCPDVKVPEQNGYNDIPYRRNTNQVKPVWENANNNARKSPNEGYSKEPNHDKAIYGNDLQKKNPITKCTIKTQKENIFECQQHPNMRVTCRKQNEYKREEKKENQRPRIKSWCIEESIIEPTRDLNLRMKDPLPGWKGLDSRYKSVPNLFLMDGGLSNGFYRKPTMNSLQSVDKLGEDVSVKLRVPPVKCNIDKRNSVCLELSCKTIEECVYFEVV